MLKDLVDELMTLNDDNLAQRVRDNSDVQWCLSELQDMLAVDVAPVVHGRWNIMDGYKVRRACSVCGWDVPEYGKFYSYCPNCGAKMDGGDGDAAD